MNQLEDEPQDVQDARPVEDEVRNADTDTVADVKSQKKAEMPPKHACQKENGLRSETNQVWSVCLQKNLLRLARKVSIKTVADCCELKRKCHEDSKAKKYATVFIHQKPCTLYKEARIPRHCMSKSEYLDFLAKPKKVCESQCIPNHRANLKCRLPCEKIPVKRRIRNMSPRIEELAKPLAKRLRNTLEDNGAILQPEMIDRLVELLEGETTLTPEQAENFVRDHRASKKPKEKKSKIDCCKEAERPPCQPICEAGDLIDSEAAETQYCMSKLFVRSILSYSCDIPRDDYVDIADTVLEMLSELLNYEPCGKEDRKSRQMMMLADAFACWIAGILLRISEKRRAELEELCQRRKKELEEQAVFEALKAAENQNEDEDVCKMPELGDDSLIVEESDDGIPVDSIGIQTDPIEEPPPPPKPEPVQEEQQTEAEVKFDVETETPEVKSPIESEVEQICEKVNSCFDTEVPFITLAKIAETLYTMLEDFCQNDLTDPINNRLHRALYEKLHASICRENPELLTERNLGIINGIAGKLVCFVRATFKESQCRFLLEETPAKVESKEVREWSKWLDNLTDQADVWTKWIEKVATEAKDMKCVGRVTRGAWEDWTSHFESNALRWRETYLQALHQQHFNRMMITDREVVKTGTKFPPNPNEEKTLKSINFEASELMPNKMSGLSKSKSPDPSVATKKS